MVNGLIKLLNLSTSRYILASIIITHLILLPFLYKTLIYIYKTNTYEQFETQAKDLSGILSDVLSTKHLLDDFKSISETLDSAILGGKINYIDIVGREDFIITPTMNTAIVERNFKEDAFVGDNNDDMYFIKIPFYFKQPDNVAYHLRVGFDETHLNNQFILAKNSIILIIMAYFILMVAIITINTRYISTPIRQLRKYSNEIASGNTEIELHSHSNLTDVKDLSHDLEKMRLALVNLALRMQHKATHDDLTGLPNRFLFTDRLQGTVTLSARNQQSFAVLLIDLNRFKEINDTLGHNIGDEVLKIVADRMHKAIRESDTLARIGGDEFAVILIDVGLIVAEKIARKIIKLTEPTFNVNGHSLKIGASIGISIFPDDGSNPGILMQKSDIAMYNAKNNNLNITSYHPDLDSDHYENLMLSHDLKTGIENGDFKAKFQPKINIKNRDISGCELLLRWDHPELGLILPDKFIPLAEKDNLIGELTTKTIKQHASQFKKLISINPEFTISINISPNDLLDASLLESIKKIVTEDDLPATNLYIEVTENAIMKNPVRSIDILNRFNDLGIRVSVDDFGTGYSSLAYLQKFPISELKIDKSFITNLNKDSNNYPIVSATITMAHDLGISVVAEGVEQEETLALLGDLDCDLAQGFYFGQPLYFEEIISWLNNYNNQ
ncbi:MAG: bifunctional diguanylate cyclase/phosphodiesterase [Gammaproteobacteria bacterium]|nr:bifunctional diguanylate cyclase/phosphodiesterase [Gammaproteobacteria bacterium]MCW8910342.1 bifunctional diguanylate cyclase/phosphodiesterase [Gammaproteobacteria bacterium]